MKKIKNFGEFINEGFIKNNKSLNFNADSKDFLNTKLGKKDFKFRETSLHNYKVYSIYQKTIIDDEDDITSNDVLNALKNQSDYKISNEDINILLNRAAILSYKNLEKENIDTFAIIESSSQFSKTFLNYILKRYSNKPNVISISKNDNFDEIYIDKNTLSEKTVKSFETKLQKLKEQSKFKIKVFNPPSFRKFVKNWMKIKDSYKKFIENKNICIIDDFITSGSTMEASIAEINKFNPKNIIGLTLLK